MDMTLLVALKAKADKFVTPFKQSIAVSDKFNKSIKNNRVALSGLNKSQKQLDRFRDLVAGSRETSSAFKQQQQKAELLSRTLSQTVNPTKRLTQEAERAQRGAHKLKQRLRAEREELAQLRRNLDSAGHSGKRLADRQNSIDRATRKANTSIDSQAKKLKRLQGAQEKYNKVKRSAQRAAVVGALALGVTGGAFAQQENASIDLKIALLDKSGDTPAKLEKINSIAEKLGNKLPGTTADFYKAAQALSEQGVSQEVIANGGLKSASYLSVLLQRNTEQMSNMVAKQRESFGLSGKELEKMADITQRTKFAFGLDPESMNAATAQMGSRLVSMNLGGVENAKKIMAIQGMAAQAGIEGGEFGTSFKNLLKETAFINENLNKKSFEGIKQLLDSKNIEFDFFNKDGSFAGVEHMINLLENAGGKLNDQERTQVFSRLFKERGEKLATLLSKHGEKGFKQALKHMDNQASLDQRIDLKTSGFGAHIEALTGSLTGLASAVFEPFGNAIKPGIKYLNELIGKLTDFVKEGGAGVTIVAGLTSGFLAWRGAMLAGSVALGLLGGGLPGATGAFIKHFTWVKKAGAGLKWLATRSIPLLLTVMRGAGVALLANPIGATIAVLVTGAALIYKNWNQLNSWWKSWTWRDVGENIGEVFFNMAYKLQNKWGEFKTWWGSWTIKDIGQNVGEYLMNIPDKIKAKWEALKTWFKNFKFKVPNFDIKMPDVAKKFNNFKKGMQTGKNRAEMTSRLENKDYYNLMPGKKELTAAAMIASLALPANAKQIKNIELNSAQVDSRPSLSVKQSKPAIKRVTVNNNIVVNGQPGMNEAELARKTADEIEKRNIADSSDGDLYDDID